MCDQEKELNDINRLMVLLLLKLGSTSDEIALAFQVDSSVVRRLIPARQVKKIVGEKAA